jgi:septal ring factor EnvC (AmiA/AmiB activator)
MAMKLSLSHHAILESASLGIALVALALSGATFWYFREHLHTSRGQFESINEQIGNTDSSSLVHQNDFQQIQTQVESLNNGLWETKQNLSVLQDQVEESRTSIQSLQSEINIYKTQISTLEADKAVLASCIETINPVAAQMSVIPASLSTGSGIAEWVTSRSVGAWSALESVQTFNVLWNAETGSCETARSIALN